MSLGRILYVYAGPTEARRSGVARGELPSETLYSLVELRAAGWEIDVADEPFRGPMGTYFRSTAAKLRRFEINLIDWRTLRRFGNYDAVVVKDSLSMASSLQVKLLGTPSIFLDSLFHLPRSRARRTMIRLAVHGARFLVGYSRTQADFWSSELGVNRDRFQELPFGLDLSFYHRCAAPALLDRPYVLAVGRDPGRDYPTLVSAIERCGYRLKLVTLPYLVPACTRSDSRVDILENVSYPELFELYRNAEAVVVPLTDRLTYPSGIRGMLEGMALGRPVVATGTPCLEEYADHEQQVLFVEPRSADALSGALLRLRDDTGLSQRLTESARARVEQHFTVQHAADGLHKLLLRAIGGT